MIFNIPLDIKAEALLGYIPRAGRTIELKGAHKRNAYEDIAGVSEDESGMVNIAIARNGMYDILPESLFHPIDRFDNIPANEYKGRFKEECEQQQIEEENARRYFRPFDESLMELSAIIGDTKNDLGSTRILEDIICDSIQERYGVNRFVRKTKEFLPMCRNIRGNKSLLVLMLRNVLFDEYVRISEQDEPVWVKDNNPRYNYRLDVTNCEGGGLFLGEEFAEKIIVYNIQYWKDEECGQDFLNFVKDMEVFEDFLNDYFMGLETSIKFNISAATLPVRLSDEVFYTYLNYNTNL